ncbi:MAG: DUF6504 family protein [Dehalococcoidia bacterium]
MPPATRRLRSLNTPRRVTVEAGSDGRPVSVALSGRRFAIEDHRETWRIDDEWWRPKLVSRLYWRVVTEDGRSLDLYRDLVSGDWFRQAYGA